MNIVIDQHSQQQVDQLRIDLAQALMDLSEVRVNDIGSRHAKEKSINGLRKIRDSLDRLGIRHSAAARYENRQKGNSHA